MKAHLAPVLSLALCAAARADLLVVPTHAFGSYEFVLSSPGGPPIERERSREATLPSAFSGSGSVTYGPAQGNSGSAGAGFDNLFFFVFPTGEVNEARISGTASGAARIGSSSPAFLQSTASSADSAEFDVATEIRYDLTGALTVSGAASTGAGALITMAGVELLRNNATYSGINSALSLPQNASLPINQSGTLLPGHYVLRGYATAATTSSTPDSQWAGNVSFLADMTFTAIPEPHLAAPLALALLYTRRRRA